MDTVTAGEMLQLQGKGTGESMRQGSLQLFHSPGHFPLKEKKSQRSLDLELQPHLKNRT